MYSSDFEVTMRNPPMCISSERRHHLTEINETEDLKIDENEELDFVDVNVDLLLKNIRKVKNISLLAFAQQLRSTFLIDVDWDRDNDYRLSIRMSKFQIIYLFDIDTDEKFINCVKIALKKIWNAHLCLHCNMLVFESDLICNSCELLSIVTYKDKECIICKESIHPILFRCQTCIDSQTCILCETKKPIKKQCSICQVKQGVPLQVRQLQEQFF